MAWKERTTKKAFSFPRFHCGSDHGQAFVNNDRIHM